MAGRAKIVIDAKELSVYESLVSELELNGYTIEDNSNIKVSFLTPYTPTHTERFNKAMNRLERYIDINGSKIVSKGELSKILGVGRPTLDAWIEKRLLIAPLISQNGEPPNLKTFEIELSEVKKVTFNDYFTCACYAEKNLTTDTFLPGIAILLVLY